MDERTWALGETDAAVQSRRAGESVTYAPVPRRKGPVWETLLAQSREVTSPGWSALYRAQSAFWRLLEQPGQTFDLERDLQQVVRGLKQAIDGGLAPVDLHLWDDEEPYRVPTDVERLRLWSAVADALIQCAIALHRDQQ